MAASDTMTEENYHSYMSMTVAQQMSDEDYDYLLDQNDDNAIEEPVTPIQHWFAPAPAATGQWDNRNDKHHNNKHQHHYWHSRKSSKYSIYSKKVPGGGDNYVDISSDEYYSDSGGEGGKKRSQGRSGKKGHGKGMVSTKCCVASVILVVCLLVFAWVLVILLVFHPYGGDEKDKQWKNKKDKKGNDGTSKTNTKQTEQTNTKSKTGSDTDTKTKSKTGTSTDTGTKTKTGTDTGTKTGTKSSTSTNTSTKSKTDTSTTTKTTTKPKVIAYKVPMQKVKTQLRTQCDQYCENWPQGQLTCPKGFFQLAMKSYQQKPLKQNPAKFLWKQKSKKNKKFADFMFWSSMGYNQKKEGIPESEGTVTDEKKGYVLTADVDQWLTFVYDVSPKREDGVGLSEDGLIWNYSQSNEPMQASMQIKIIDSSSNDKLSGYGGKDDGNDGDDDDKQGGTEVKKKIKAEPDDPQAPPKTKAKIDLGKCLTFSTGVKVKYRRMKKRDGVDKPFYYDTYRCDMTDYKKQKNGHLKISNLLKDYEQSDDPKKTPKQPYEPVVTIDTPLGTSQVGKPGSGIPKKDWQDVKYDLPLGSTLQFEDCDPLSRHPGQKWVFDFPSIGWPSRFETSASGPTQNYKEWAFPLEYQEYEKDEFGLDDLGKKNLANPYPGWGSGLGLGGDQKGQIRLMDSDICVGILDSAPRSQVWNVVTASGKGNKKIQVITEPDEYYVLGFVSCSSKETIDNPDYKKKKPNPNSLFHFNIPSETNKQTPNSPFGNGCGYDVICPQAKTQFLEKPDKDPVYSTNSYGINDQKTQPFSTMNGWFVLDYIITPSIAAESKSIVDLAYLDKIDNPDYMEPKYKGTPKGDSMSMDYLRKEIIEEGTQYCVKGYGFKKGPVEGGPPDQYNVYDIALTQNYPYTDCNSILQARKYKMNDDFPGWPGKEIVIKDHYKVNNARKSNMLWTYQSEQRNIYDYNYWVYTETITDPENPDIKTNRTVKINNRKTNVDNPNWATQRWKKLMMLDGRSGEYIEQNLRDWAWASTREWYPAVDSQNWQWSNRESNADIRPYSDARGGGEIINFRDNSQAVDQDMANCNQKFVIQRWPWNEYVWKTPMKATGTGGNGGLKNGGLGKNNIPTQFLPENVYNGDDDNFYNKNNNYGGVFQTQIGTVQRLQNEDNDVFLNEKGKSATGTDTSLALGQRSQATYRIAYLYSRRCIGIAGEQGENEQGTTTGTYLYNQMCNDYDQKEGTELNSVGAGSFTSSPFVGNFYMTCLPQGSGDGQLGIETVTYQVPKGKSQPV